MVARGNCSPVLKVDNLGKIYGPGCPHCVELTGPEHGRNVCPKCLSIVAFHGISFELFETEILGIVGESGSGKSSLLRCLHLDEDPCFGSLYHQEVENGRRDLFTCSWQQKRTIRTRLLAVVYQSPHLGLRMGLTAGANVAEPLLVNHHRPNFGATRSRVMDLFNRVELPIDRVDYPIRSFSGGMQQRVQIARALACNPSVLLLDEPTSGLDVSVQASVLDLIRRIQWETGLPVVIVSHDLGVIRLLTTRTLVMRFGRVVEAGLTDQILSDPQHPYTQQLVASALT